MNSQQLFSFSASGLAQYSRAVGVALVSRNKSGGHSHTKLLGGDLRISLHIAGPISDLFCRQSDG
jgi:hypothetical protein